VGASAALAAPASYRTRVRGQRSHPREDRLGAHDTITVLNPVGFAPKVTRKPLARRLDTLDGKTVYLADCRFDDSDVFLE